MFIIFIFSVTIIIAARYNNYVQTISCYYCLTVQDSPLMLSKFEQRPHLANQPTPTLAAGSETLPVTGEDACWALRVTRQ